MGYCDSLKAHCELLISGRVLTSFENIHPLTDSSSHKYYQPCQNNDALVQQFFFTSQNDESVDQWLQAFQGGSFWKRDILVREMFEEEKGFENGNVRKNQTIEERKLSKWKPLKGVHDGREGKLRRGEASG